MTKTVVHVTTIEEWKSVLDVWFEQGYKWLSDCGKDFKEHRFNLGSRELGLNVCGNDKITYWRLNDYNGDNLIEYSDFMKQGEKTMAKETYYVTHEQLDLIESLKENEYPVYNFYGGSKYRRLATLNKLSSNGEKALLRYIGGDKTIEFKVKEQLYRLWRINNADNKVYMEFNLGTPDWTFYEDYAFTAPLDEIKKWKTPAWEIEEAE